MQTFHTHPYHDIKLSIGKYCFFYHSQHTFSMYKPTCICSEAHLKNIRHSKHNGVYYVLRKLLQVISGECSNAAYFDETNTE